MATLQVGCTGASRSWADAFDYDFALFLVGHGARVNYNLVKKYGLEEDFEEIRKSVQSGNWRDPPN